MGYEGPRVRTLAVGWASPRADPSGLLSGVTSPPSLKYARVERERRWLLATTPSVSVADDVLAITDRYLTGSRLRLRETVSGAGDVVRKLGHKVRLTDGPGEVACTSLYLDDAEWALLCALEAHVLSKERHRMSIAAGHVAVDVFGGHCAGLVLVEIDRGDGADTGLPDGFAAVAEVTADERFTGGRLAEGSRQELLAAVEEYGLKLRQIT